MEMSFYIHINRLAILDASLIGHARVPKTATQLFQNEPKLRLWPLRAFWPNEANAINQQEIKGLACEKRSLGPYGKGDDDCENYFKVK
jgi:hypothetical protein